MGLQIVRNIVEYQLKGSVDIDNSAGAKWTIKFKDNLYEERI
jgi:two-component sensor histidine kinase